MRQQYNVEPSSIGTIDGPATFAEWLILSVQVHVSNMDKADVPSGHKAADCPNKKSNQNECQKSETQQKKKQHGKGDSKGKGYLDMSKIICFNCGEYGHFAHDCRTARDNANIAQESEQKGKSESMLDLESTSVSKECVMVYTELQYEDTSEDEVVYGDQGISVEKQEKATYGDLTKTQREEEDEVKCTVSQRANNSMMLERKRRQFNENNPDK